MAGSLTKQPNGLYCRFSSIVDCPTHWNMTEEEYIEMSSEYQSKAEALDTIENYLQPFHETVFRHNPNNMTFEEFSEFLMETNAFEDQNIFSNFVRFLWMNREVFSKQYMKPLITKYVKFNYKENLNKECLDYKNSIQELQEYIGKGV